MKFGIKFIVIIQAQRKNIINWYIHITNYYNRVRDNKQIGNSNIANYFKILNPLIFNHFILFL